jgi:hypothetical protein
MHELPTPHQLAADPELGALYALNECGRLTVRMLIATYPEIADEERPYWLFNDGDACREAHVIVDLIHRLHLAITVYQQSLSGTTAALR